MVDCSSLISIEDQQKAKLEVGSITEFVESSNATLLTPEGQTKKTLTGIVLEGNAVISGLGWDNKGEFSTLPPMSDANDVAVFEGNFWVTTETLPYTATGSSPLTPPEAGKWVVAVTAELLGIARSLNKKNNAVEYTTYAGLLDDKENLYDAVEQAIWSIPTLDSTGKTIVSVSPAGELITTGGSGASTYQMVKTPIARTLSFETIADLQASVGLEEGDEIWIGERGWHFTVTSSETPDTFAVIDVDGTLQATVQPISGFIGIESCGAIPSDDSFDSQPVIISAWSRGRLVKFFTQEVFYLDSELRYPGNAHELHGTQAAPFGSRTILVPLDNTFSDVSLIDMNENGSGGVSTGGQYNRLVDICIQGRMVDWDDPGDPLVNLIGVNGDQTIDGCNMVNVAFRLCGKPFAFTGWKHWHENIIVHQCFTGGDLSSTNSSVIDKYNIQTCSKNWGSLSGCTIKDATIQQGNEKQTLDDDIGMSCSNGVKFSGFLYTEGGNAQIYVEDGETVTADNWEMGFTNITGGGFGHHNIRVGAGSSIIVNGGKSAGVKSYLVGGSPDAAHNIHIDIEEHDGRFFDTTAEELPDCPNLFFKRTFGTITRANNHNQITLPVYNIGVSTVTLWSQFVTPGAFPFGGEIEVHVGGSNTYDLYRVDFTDSSSGTEQVAINTIFRNTGGSGDNNINLSYAANALTAVGRKSDQKIGVKVSGHGQMWPKQIA